MEGQKASTGRKVYISSTYSDLVDYRAAVCDVLHKMRYDTVAMEYYVATDKRPVEKCMADVAKSDIYVGIFAWRYGYIPLGHESSITELEYTSACENKIDRLIFLTHEDTPWPRSHVEAGSGQEKIDKLRRLLSSNHTVEFFGTPEELASKVAASISRLTEERVKASMIELRQRRDQADNERAGSNQGMPAVNPPPVFLSQFLNRDTECRELLNFIADDAVRLTSIVGRGGIGKSALITSVFVDFAANKSIRGGNSGHGIDHVLWLNSRTTGFGMERIAADTGLLLGGDTAVRLAQGWAQQGTTLAAKIQLIIESLSGTGSLVVFDGFEDALGRTGEIEDKGLRCFVESCLEHARSPRIVITSRKDPLFPYHSLNVIRTIHLNHGLAGEEAVSLLKNLDPQGELGLLNAPNESLERAVAVTKGIPRAMELLAGILHRDPVANLENLLNENILQSMTVERMVAEGYQRLEEDEQRVMQAIAIFNRPIDATAVIHLLQPWFPGVNVHSCLNRLVRSHFLMADRATGLYGMQSLDRDQAYRTISESSNSGQAGTGDDNQGFTRQGLELRAADFHASLRKSPDKWRSIDDVTPQLHEFQHCIRAGAYDRAVELLEPVDQDHLFLWGHYSLLIDLRTRAVGRCQNTKWEISNLGHLAISCQVLSQFDEAISYYRKAIEMAAIADDLSAEGMWNGHLGRLYRNRGQMDEALACTKEALRIAVESDDLRDESFWSDRLGLVYRSTGQLPNALESHKRGLALAREVGDLRGEGASLSNLGLVHYVLGDLDNAAECYTKALSIAAKIGDRRGKAIRNNRLGRTALDRGKNATAKEAFDKALSIAAKLGDRREQAYALIGLAQIRLASGEDREAIEQLVQARNMHTTETDYLACLALGIARYRVSGEEAYSSFADAIDSCQELLNQSESLFEVRYALAIARTGLTVCNRSWTEPAGRSALLEPNLNDYRQALNTCYARGVVERTIKDIGHLRQAGADGLDPILQMLNHALIESQLPPA